VAAREGEPGVAAGAGPARAAPAADRPAASGRRSTVAAGGDRPRGPAAGGHGRFVLGGQRTARAGGRPAGGAAGPSGSRAGSGAGGPAVAGGPGGARRPDAGPRDRGAGDGRAVNLDVRVGIGVAIGIGTGIGQQEPGGAAVGGTDLASGHVVAPHRLAAPGLRDEAQLDQPHADPLPAGRPGDAVQLQPRHLRQPAVHRVTQAQRPRSLAGAVHEAVAHLLEHALPLGQDRPGVPLDLAQRHAGRRGDVLDRLTRSQPGLDLRGRGRHRDSGWRRGSGCCRRRPVRRSSLPAAAVPSGAVPPPAAVSATGAAASTGAAPAAAPDGASPARTAARSRSSMATRKPPRRLPGPVASTTCRPSSLSATTCRSRTGPPSPAGDTRPDRESLAGGDPDHKRLGGAPASGRRAARATVPSRHPRHPQRHRGAAVAPGRCQRAPRGPAARPRPPPHHRQEHPAGR
jgi:hypothetical protein